MRDRQPRRRRPPSAGRPQATPSLSVVIPAYNQPQMLRECLQSLATVTVDCEIVVVDDASPTDLTAVVTHCAETDPRIRFLRNPANLGITRNFNRAVAEARSEYICLMGHDDTSLPGNFEKKLAILDAHPEVGFVYSGHYYTDAANRPTSVAQWPGMLPFSYIGGRDEFMDLLPWNYISLHSVVYRRQLFERYGGFDENITECGNDWELNLRYCYQTQTAFINEPLLNVRLHEHATTRQLGFYQGKLADGRIQVWRKWLVDRDPPVVLHDRTWDVIQQLFVRDVHFWFRQDETAVQHWLRQFEQLRQDHLRAVQKRFRGFAMTAPAFDSSRPVGSPEKSELSLPPTPSPLPVIQPAADAIQVVWEGGFFETHSLALVNREMALAALQTGKVELSLRLRQLEAVKFDPRGDPRMAPLLARVDRPLDGPAAIHIRHAWPPVFDRPQARTWVMVQPWEYGRLPVDWVPPMRDQVDEIWAYSTAVKAAYVDSGVPAEKIHVIPLGIDPECFRPDSPPLSLPSKKSFRFLFVGGTIWRKGIDVLLEAYRRTFTRADDVSLVIKDMGQDSYYKGQGAAETIARLQADPNAPEILYITGSLTDRDMATLYTACHCLVHPYRGEGFGLPVAEAMACGLAVIVSQGGACDDFCTDDRAFLIPAERRPIDIQVATAGQAWVLEPNVEALSAMMRDIAGAPHRAAERGARASSWVRSNLTWQAAGGKAVDRLEALVARGGTVSLPVQPSPRRLDLEAFEKGKHYLNQGRWQEAEEALNQALSINAGLAGARYLLGCCYLQLARHEAALAQFDAALAAQSQVSDFWNGRGCALRELGRTHEAREAFERALALDPVNADARANLGELQMATPATPDGPPAPAVSAVPDVPSPAPGYYGQSRPEVVNLIPNNARRVLDVGCAGGAMGALIKQKLGAEVIGIEGVTSVAQVAASRLDKVVVQDLDCLTSLPVPDAYFDCIVFADVLEHLVDPARLLRVLRRYLHPAGAIVCSIPNVRNWTTLGDLLVNGNWTYADEGILDRTHLRFFTLVEIERLLAEQGFHIDVLTGSQLAPFAGIEHLAGLIASLGGDPDRLRAESVIFQYIFRARQTEQPPSSRMEKLAARHTKLPPLMSLVPPAAKRVLDFTNQGGRASGRTTEREVVRAQFQDASAAKVPAFSRDGAGRLLLDFDSPAGLPSLEPFDCILLGDVLARVRQPEVTLRTVKGWLAEGGLIAMAIPNVRHLSVLSELTIDGRWRPPQSHVKFYTRSEIDGLLSHAGLRAVAVSAVRQAAPHAALERFTETLGCLGGDQLRFREETETSHFLVTAEPAL